MKNVIMEMVPISEEERYDRIGDNYFQSINSHNQQNHDNINDDVCIPIDLHPTGINNISPVHYSHIFIDYEEMKTSKLLNLDTQTERRTPILGLNFDNDDSSCNKLFPRNEMDSEMEMESHNDWMNKRIEEWSKLDSTNWYIHEGMSMGHSYSEMADNLAIPGEELLQLSKREFVKRDKCFGHRLYDSLHKRHCSTKLSPLFTKLKFEDESSLVSSTNYSDGESTSGSECVKKRPPGRPRISKPKEKEVRVKLWEFVRDMLHNPMYCPALIRWDDYGNKRFRFVKSDQVAKLWGKRKKNNNMTYEKFSRAMRYYYKKKIFKMVPGRRLVYEFDENATGLETENPNFGVGNPKV